MGWISVVAALTLALPLLAFPQDRDAARVDRAARQYEIEQLKPLFDKAYEAGSDYYKNGWRSEALWCFDRATKLLPEAGNLQRFTNLLRDFDNPVWKKKRWKSPRAGVDAGFKRRQQNADADYVVALLKIAGRHRKDDDPAAQTRARSNYRAALEVVGGPYEQDGEGRLLLGKSGTIPADASAALVAEEMARINGKLWLRDSMLRSLPNDAPLFEARDEELLIRTTTTVEEAERLHALLKQATPPFESRLGGRRTSRPLGLFVFGGKDAYQKWCKESGHDAQLKAAGFANVGEGFAVTFAQSTLDKTAVHEAAHLWHHDVYAAPMPSWYDEGVACFFGHERSMTVTDGKLTTGIAPTAAALKPLLATGRLAVPLEDLLGGDATLRIAADDGSAPNWYLEAWALYVFLSTTKDPRLSSRFEEWESFALGSRGAPKGDAAALFDRVFADQRDTLEAAFVAWIADPR